LQVIQYLYKMATIEISLSRKKRSGSGEQQIYMRLSVDRTHVYRVKTGLFVPSERWDQKSQRVILPRMRTVGNLPLIRLQEKLDSLTNGIIEKTNTTPIRIINKVWLQEIISNYNGEATTTDTTKTSTDDSSDISIILDKFIKARCKSHRRADHFHCMERMIKRFCLYAAVPYTLDDFSAENMKQFETFLGVEHTFFNEKGECIKHKAVYEVEPCKKVPKQRGINAINEVFRRFRTFYNWAVSNGYTKNNPFGKYQIPGCVYGTPLYMTSEERDKLFEFDFSNRPGLAVQRDIFVFQSNVGMRAGDMMELTRKNVVDGGIEYVANKTVHNKGTTIRVPLTAQAQTILDRYDSYKGIELFPFCK